MNKNSVVFICNAGKDDGLGHLMRCLVLADAISKKKVSTLYFLSDDLEGIVEDKAILWGFNFKKVANVMDYEGEDHFLYKHKGYISWVIIDSKSISESFVNWCLGFTKVLHFDDHFYRNFKSNLIVNNHLGNSKSNYAKNQKSKLLIGTEFNTVHDSFFNLKKIRKSDQYILITLGGEDPDDYTSWLLKGLSELLKNHRVVVVLGPANPNYKNVEKSISLYTPHADLVFSPSKMSDYMIGAKVAITAGGITCYELAAAMVPQAIIILEYHQKFLAESLVNSESACLLGSYENIKVNNVQRKMSLLMEDYSLLNHMSNQAASLLRENGSLRIAEEMDLIN